MTTAAPPTNPIAGVPIKDALAAVRRVRERRDFGRWLEAVSPPPEWNWEWAHLRYIREKLDKITKGERSRLMISMPPQHGKSEQTTARYPAWRLERDPALRVAVACYDKDHAKSFSRKIRRFVRQRKVELSKDRQSVAEWETKAGGYLKAVGVGSGIAGKPVDLMVVDDPFRSRKDAESPAYRDTVAGWYAEDLYPRLQKDAAVIIIATRWHEDDLIGRILASEERDDWEVINLPAVAEENDPLGRKPGEALCPDRFDLAALERKRIAAGPGWYALYQGRPVPRGGAMFKAEWFDRAWVPAAAVPPLAAELRYWDLAATEDGNWSAGVREGRSADRVFYVTDVRRGRWSPAERDRVIRETAERDGPGVKIFINKDPGQAGVSQIADLAGKLAGFVMEGVRETGSKETRAAPFASQFQTGNVRVVRSDWSRAFEAEFLSFPHGKYDDQVDASAGGFNKLANVESKYEREELLVL